MEPELFGKVIIVDDLSPFEIETELQSLGVKILRHKTRVSYSKMINSSIAYTKSLGAELLITVNNDIEHQTKFLDHLSEIFKMQNVSTIGCQLFYPDGLTQHAGVEVLDYNGPWAMDRFRQTQIIPPSRFCHHVTGAWQAIKLDRIHGKYNEFFPFSFEDVDFCLRQWENGKQVFYTNKIFHIHHESVTRSNRLTPRELQSSRLFRSTSYPLDLINQNINTATTEYPLGTSHL